MRRLVQECKGEKEEEPGAVCIVEENWACEALRHSGETKKRTQKVKKNVLSKLLFS